MKIYLPMAALLLIISSCKNSGKQTHGKIANVYDTIAEYSKFTGAHIGDTIVFVSGDSTVPFNRKDTLPGYYKALHDTSHPNVQVIPGK